MDFLAIEISEETLVTEFFSVTVTTTTVTTEAFTLETVEVVLDF